MEFLSSWFFIFHSDRVLDYLTAYAFYYIQCYILRGSFINYVDKMGGGGQKMFVFVHAQGIKTARRGGGGQINGNILST